MTIDQLIKDGDVSYQEWFFLLSIFLGLVSVVLFYFVWRFFWSRQFFKGSVYAMLLLFLFVFI